MDRGLVENILGVLKHATHKRVVVKGLIKLRTDLVKNHEGIKLFQQAGGIPPMIRFLFKPHEQIIEVALSILGNCCTDADCCKEAMQHKISNALLGILKSINNDAIQMRAFRLLGNLAKHDREALLDNYNVLSFTQDICKFLLENKNVQASIMGFRACRILMGSSKFLKNFLQNEGFPLILGTLRWLLKQDAAESTVIVESNDMLITRRGEKPHHRVHREKYFEETMRNFENYHDYDDVGTTIDRQKTAKLYAVPEDKQTQELLNELLKCLQFLADCRVSYFKSLQNLYDQRIPNIMWESKSRPDIDLEPLVALILADSRWRSIALSIVGNFSKCCYAACWLGQAQTATIVCELLQSKQDLTGQERLSCINILGQLSNDACNRSKIRRSGALSKIIWIIQNSESQTEISAILYLLNNFQYDELSLKLMLCGGIVPVLIRELNAYLSCGDDDARRKKREDKIQTAKKRKLNDEDIESMIKLSKLNVNMALDYESPSSSPKASTSPCSSRSISPAFSSSFATEEEDDEAYSPICSDDDDDDEEEKEKTTIAINDPLTSIMQLLDTENRTDLMEDDVSDKEDVENEPTAKEDAKNQQAQTMRCTNIDRLEHLIFRLTLLADKRWELGRSETIMALIKAINLFGAKNSFSGSLTNILLESKFFEQIVRQGIPHQIYQMTKIKQIRSDGFTFMCTLTCVGESHYGKSELVRLLESKDLNWQKRSAIAIAYIIKTPQLLYSFLKRGNVINILFEIALDDVELNAEAIDAITCMSQNSLNITLPAENETNLEYELFDDETTLHEHCDMRFVLHVAANITIENDNDHEVLVAFNKQLLCDASEVFDTMLNSDFREGHELEIHLYSYTSTGLRYFLNLIMRHARGQLINAPTIENNHTLLEALEMSRVYIMPVLETALFELLLTRLDENNCLSVLEWSIQNRHHQLNDMAVNYYLSSSLCAQAKIKLYREAHCSPLATEWQEMLSNALLERCNLSNF